MHEKKPFAKITAVRVLVWKIIHGSDILLIEKLFLYFLYVNILQQMVVGIP
jgi:hypothetical protein